MFVESLLVKTPRERRYRCNNCNRAYTHLRSLTAHQKHECGKEPKFKCPVKECPYNSKLKGNWKQHIVYMHPDLAKKLFGIGDISV